MNVQSHVEILRLHYEHLRTLIDHVISELTTTEQVLATKEHPSSASVAPTMSRSAAVILRALSAPRGGP